MSNPFTAPAPATGGITWADHLGRLLVIEPAATETIKTTFGDNEAIRADVHVLDGPDPGTFEDTLIFPKVLAAQLRPRIGAMVLGRLGQGQAKPGQSAPWLILEPTDADTAAAVAWLTARRAGTFAAPATGAEPPF